MKKILSVLLFAVLLLGIFAACGETETPVTDEEPPKANYGPRKILVTDQKNKCISLYDIDKKDWTTPDWTWTSKEPTFTNVDGVKYRYDNNAECDVLALCSSGGYVAMITYPRGEVLSFVRNAGGNPHSVEVLPDGALVLAASTGNYVRIYDTSSFGDVSKKYKEIYVPDAHGVLWDPEMEILWALGGNKLYAYEVTEDHDMIHREDLTIPLLAGGGHDLQPVYGKPDWFWVTMNEKVMQVNKKTKEIEIRYDGWVTLSALAGVKGIGNFMDGTVVVAQAANVWREWNTDIVMVGTVDPATESFVFEERKIPDAAYYKLRVLERDYLGPKTEEAKG